MRTFTTPSPKLATAAPAALLAAGLLAAPASADLAVTQDLGTIATRTTSVAGTTVGKPNNAVTYSSTGSSTVIWNTGEEVYQFDVTKPAFLYLSNTVEVDDTGTFPSPNTDYWLLNTLATTPVTTGTKANNPNLLNKPQGTSLALVQDSVGPTTAGSNANVGAFRSTANPTAKYAAGTYYISADGRSNPSATTPQPPGAHTFDLKVAYLDEVQAPTSFNTQIDPNGQITGAYNAEDVDFFKFDYDGTSGFTVSTNGSTLSNNNDTFIALYNGEGGLVAFNDETDEVGVAPLSLSRLVVPATGTGALPADTYYLGFVAYKGEANPAFDLTVFGDSTVSGQFVINGLSLVPVPEPTGLAALALLAAPLVARRRRR